MSNDQIDPSQVQWDEPSDSIDPEAVQWDSAEQSYDDRMETMARASFDSKPDVNARFKQLADKAGIPYQAAKEIPEDVERDNVASDWRGFAKEAPSSSKFFDKNPDSFDLASDDHKSLSAIEQGLVGLGKKPDATTGERVKDQAIQLTAGLSDIPKAMIGLADLARPLINIMNPASGMAWGLLEDAAGDGKETYSSMVKKLGVDFGAADAAAENLMSPASKYEAELVNKAFDQGLIDGGFALLENPAQIAESVTRSVPSMITMAMGTRAVAKSIFDTALVTAEASGVSGQAALDVARAAVSEAMPFLGKVSAGIEGAQSAGDVANDYAVDGEMTLKDFVASGGQGMTTALIGVLSNKIGGALGLEDVEASAAAAGLRDRVGGFFENIIKGAVKEGPLEEGLQSGAEAAWSNFGNDRDLTAGVGRAMVEGTLTGTAMGGGVAGATSAADIAVDKLNQRRQASTNEANETQKKLVESFNAVSGSLLGQRDKKSLQQLMDAVAEDEGNAAPTHMLVSADVFKQGGIDPEVFKAAVPSVAAEIDQAIQLGGTVSVPVGELFTGFAGTGMEQTLTEHIKVSEDAWTAFEARQQNEQEALDQFAVEAEKIRSQQSDQETWDAQAKVVYDGVLSDLEARGKFDKKVHKGYATLVRDFYSVMAPKLGMTPDQLFEKDRLRVGTVRGDGAVLNQPEYSDEEKNFFNSMGIDVGAEKSNVNTGTSESGERDAGGYRKTSDADKANYLAHISNILTDPKIRSDKSQFLRGIREESEKYTHDLRGNEKTARVGDHALGPFTAYSVEAKTYDFDKEGKEGQLEINYYGKEQIEAGLIADPALTVYLMKNGELTINGPAWESETFHAFKERGWADYAYGENGEPAPGYTRLISPTGENGQLGHDQIKSILADAHARMREWRKEDKVGVHWHRDTGATGGIMGRDGGAFFQDNDGHRAAFDPTNLNIYLLETADLSSFLHETGHFFLEMYSRYADQSAEVAQDMDALLKWFGIEGETDADRRQAWASMDLEQQREYHEKFAESFEQYLFEGKAPSVELQSLFDTFGRWLTSVYKSIANFLASHNGAKLTPEVRGVMDRMIATQEQILEVAEVRASKAMFTTQEQSGMTDAQWKAYQEDQKRSIEQPITELTGRSLRDMQYLSNAKGKALKKLQREKESLRRVARMDARKEVLSKEEYRAWLFLKRKTEGKTEKRVKSKDLDPSVDSIYTAVAKLGGLDIAEVKHEWGITTNDFKGTKGGVFGMPVFRKDGGLTIDDMTASLAQFGYLELDENGKASVTDLEELMFRESRGDKAYSSWADYDYLLYGDQPIAPSEDDVDHVGGRLDRAALVDMYGTNNPDVKWHKPFAVAPDGTLMQPAYHGSPYKFDKFSLEHMGKGEGAQAYGWGLYFAGSKEVAEYYRESLKGTVTYDGKKINANDHEPGTKEYAKSVAVELLWSWQGDKEGALDDADSYDEDARKIKAEIKKLDYSKIKTATGQLYKVEIPEDKGMIEWDSPVKGKTKKIIDGIVYDNFGGAKTEAQGKMFDEVHKEVSRRAKVNFGSVYKYLSDQVGGDEALSRSLHAVGIKGIKYLDGSSRGNEDGTYNYVIFDDSAVKVMQTFYQPAKSEGNPNFDRWSGGGEFISGADSAAKEFKSGEAVILEAFHGTQRPDRVGVKFLKKRATSGPMAFFTNAPELASGYATGKQDTSLADEDTEYKSWFKIAPPKGSRTKLNLEQAWYYLDSETKKTIADRMKDIRLDEDGMNVIYEEDGGDLGNYEWELKQARGNVMKAAIESWLMSGSIFGEEQKFMDVLRLAGFPMKTIEYDPPNAAYPFLYHVAIRMQKPLVTSDIPQNVIDALNDAAKRDRTRAGNRKADAWDKTSRTLKEWVSAFNEEDRQYVWTSIPDKVTDIFRSLGYDGIIDYSGKGGGDVHKVYIPFEENNVKSYIGNKGTFDESNNILKQEGDSKDGDSKTRSLEGMGMVSNEGLHPDVVADLFGLSSGDELVRKLLTIDDPITAIEKRTDDLMMQRHSEFTDPKAMERMAEAAIHNEARVRFVATELAMLNKAMGGVNVILKAAKMYAAEIISGQKIGDIRPAKHAADAARAGREADRMLAKGKTADTVMAKRNQVLHTEAARQSYAAQAEVDKGLGYFKRLEKAINNGRLDPDYGQQIIGLLERHDLRKSVSLLDLERRDSLSAWVQKQQDQGFEPVIPDYLLQDAAKTHYKRMTVDEFRDLVDAVKNIEHLGRLKHSLVQKLRQRQLAAAATEIGAAIEGNAKNTVKDKLEKNSLKDRAADLFNGFLYMHRKFSNLLREMDGWKDGGVLWDYFGRTMNDAGDAESKLREEATIAIDKLMQPILKDGGFGMLPRKMFIPEINDSLSREGRIMVALNWGNDGNRQRLLDGDGWSPEQVGAILKTLNRQDWEFVQGTWDFLNTYRDQVGAQQKRLTGVEPKWIEPAPFELMTADGHRVQLSGGYFPAKYDADRSTKSLTQEALNTIMDLHKSVRAKTRDSHTKGRAAQVKDRPLRKDFGVIFGHITEVSHRLAWQDWLTDSKRLMAQPAVDEALRAHYGPQMIKELQSALDDIAAGEVGPQNEFEAAINHLRTGATVAGLGYNLMTSLMQPLGLTQSMARIGSKWVAKGLAKWQRMDDALPWIYERSDMMRLRGKTMQREINEVMNQVRSPKRAKLNESFFFLIQKGQMIADIPTWLGAFEKATAEGNDDSRAAALADQAVLDAQSGGMLKDLARVQRGSSFQKLFTMFMSYFNATYNLSVEAVKRTDFKDAGSVMALGIDYLLLYTLPAALVTVMKAGLTGGDDDDEELAKRLVADQITYMMGTLVGLREFSSVVSGFNGYTGPAGTRFFSEAGKLAKQIEQGEADAAFWKALNNTGGILLHYPAGQINKTVGGADALLEDETDNPAALLFGPPR